MNYASGDEDIDRLDSVAEKLLEFYDSVQIFVDRYDTTEGTLSIARGRGNWNARIGHIRRWIEKEEESERIQIRKDDEE